LNEFILLKNLPEKKESIIYGKINSFNSNEAIAEIKLKDDLLKLIFSSKNQLKLIKANEFVRAIGNLVYNNNEPVFNVNSISVINEFDLNLLLKVIELEKEVIK
jgi:hypothetical protein